MLTFILIGLLFMLSGTFQDKQIDKMKSERVKKEEDLKKKTVDTTKVYGKEWDANVPRPRICPCCGTILERHEYLYASMSKTTDSSKNVVHIYGCRYCYLNMEKENESVQQVDF